MTGEKIQLIAAVDGSVCWQVAAEHGREGGQKVMNGDHLVAFAGGDLAGPADHPGHPKRPFKDTAYFTAKRSSRAAEVVIILTFVGDRAII